METYMHKLAEVYQNALLSANVLLAPYGIALQHVSFGPLDGLVLEVSAATATVIFIVVVAANTTGSRNYPSL